MASILNADTSDGLKFTSDTSGEIKLQSAGTDIVSVTANGIDVTGGFTVDTDTLYVDSTNNYVGIGTSSPSHELQLGNLSSVSTSTPKTISLGGTYSSSAGDNAKLKLWTDGSDVIGLGVSGNQFDYIATGAAFSHVWYTNSTERMRIDSSGKLLYGFTSSQSGGHWQHYTPANNYNIQFFSEYASGTGYFLEFIRSVSGSYNAVGTITASTTTTSYGTSSDYRLKENVTPMSGSIDRLKQLKPSTWSWVQDGSHGEGFLAHEAQTVVPEAVTGTKDAMRTEEYEVTPAVLDDDGSVVTEAVMGTREVPVYQGIDQSKLVPLLTAALQEAITKIEDLETRIQALENA